MVGIIRGVQIHIDRGQGWGWANINQEQQVAILREWGHVRGLEQCRGGGGLGIAQMNYHMGVSEMNLWRCESEMQMKRRALTLAPSSKNTEKKSSKSCMFSIES